MNARLQRVLTFGLPLTVATALLTWFVGWWSVAALALLAGAAHRERRGSALTCALAAMAAWSALLLFAASGGRMPALSAALSGVMGVPVAVLLVMTIAFAGLLGGSAAMVGGELAQLMRRRSL